MAFSITSSAFSPNGTIPRRHTCDGENLSPALSWSGAPEGTQTFALIMDDPDAPRGVFTHWVLFNLPGSTTSLPEGVPARERLDNGAVHGQTSAGRMGYEGPCPPPGRPHRYRFFLYALDTSLDLKPGATKQAVLQAIQGHILAEAQLVGTYGR